MKEPPMTPNLNISNKVMVRAGRARIVANLSITVGGGKPRALPVIKMSKMLLSLCTFLFVNERYRKCYLPVLANQSIASETPNMQLEMLLSTWTPLSVELFYE